MKRLSFIKVLVFVFILYFTFILRAHEYDRVPTAGHLDEQLFAWSGIYLVETGTPVSWSTLDYPIRAKVFGGTIYYKGGLPSAGVNLYKPWLDEPPLFSYLVGYFAHIFGAVRTDFIPASFIRFPMIFVSTLSSIFVFLVAKKLSGYWMGICAMTLYGTIPLMVFASRTAMPENVIALFLIVSVYFLLRFKEKKNFWWVFPIPVFAGIAGLCKPTGYFILPFSLFFVFKWLYEAKKLKTAIKYCLVLAFMILPFVAAFFAWGIKWDAEIFWRITKIQGNRPVGFGSFIWYFISPAYATTVFRDSLFVFCLISAVYFLFSVKDGVKKIIPFAFVYWLIIIMLSGGENDLLTWYRFPTYPVLAILGAWGVGEILKRSDFFATLIAAGGFLGNRPLLVNAFRSNFSPTTFRILMAGILSPSILTEIFNTKRLKTISKFVLIGVILLGIYMNAVFIYSAFEITCEGATCPIVDSTFLSLARFPSVIRWFLVDLPGHFLWKARYSF